MAMQTWIVSLMALTASAATTAAQAQTYPNRPVTMIVTAAAGGVTDVVARAVGQRLSIKWGQQVVIENRGGAGHILGAQAVAKAQPDGYTLMVSEAGSYVINPNIYPKDKLPYDIDKDFIQITGLVRIHHALLATPSLPVKSLAELVALAKKEPATITYGTAGVGTGPHLNMVRLENAAGVKLTAVHYRGATPALTDVMGGHTKTMLISVGSALSPAKTGKVKMLAVGSEKRLPALPDLPTAAETVPGFIAGTWFGLSATAGTPRDIIMKINADVREAINHPSIQETFVQKQLYETMTSSPEEFDAYVKAEKARWAQVIREQGLKIGH
jgi:tripartite-type tricarboxylate transporter receptor subunit TctC